MSMTPIAHIIAAVPQTFPCGLKAKNRFFQPDICAAYELFMRVMREATQSGQNLCKLQINFPQQDTFAPEKALLFEAIRLGKSDLEKIHNIIDLLLKNPMPCLGTCVDFWTWAESRFKLISSA